MTAAIPADPATILVVAATARELAPAAGWRTLVCGVGPVEAAIATARTLAEARPAAVLHVGVAGARATARLAPPQLVIGSEAIYSDAAPGDRWVPGRLVVAPALVEAARRACPGAQVAAIGTSARVGGTAGTPVEAMEGFAVLAAAARAGLPALEVRAVSNLIDEPDRAQWRLEEACAAIRDATPRLVAALAGVLE